MDPELQIAIVESMKMELAKKAPKPRDKLFDDEEEESKEEGKVEEEIPAEYMQ